MWRRSHSARPPAPGSRTICSVEVLGVIPTVVWTVAPTMMAAASPVVPAYTAGSGEPAGVVRSRNARNAKSAALLPVPPAPVRKPSVR